MEIGEHPTCAPATSRLCPPHLIVALPRAGGRRCQSTPLVLLKMGNPLQSQTSAQGDAVILHCRWLPSAAIPSGFAQLYCCHFRSKWLKMAVAERQWRPGLAFAVRGEVAVVAQRHDRRVALRDGGDLQPGATLSFRQKFTAMAARLVCKSLTNDTCSQ